MGPYLGDYNTGANVYLYWDSNGADGASITRATNGTISVYKADGTTQITTGVTDTEDFDSLTGVHCVKIDTSSDGTFYAAGSDFHIVLSGATIDGKTVNAVLGSFSLLNRSALRPTTAGRTLDVASTGEAGLDFGNTTGTGSGGFARATNGIVTGTVGSASTTTSIVTSALSPAAAVTDQLKGRIVVFANDTTTTNLRGQATDVTGSSSGGVLTVTALTTAPVSGDTFSIQ